MKTNYFVVNFFVAEEGEEKAIIDAVFNDKAEAEAYAKAQDSPETNDYYRVVSMEEGYYHLTKFAFDYYDNGEPVVFEDLGEFVCEEDACEALKEEVETTNYYPLNEEYMERDGEVYDDYITYGLYEGKDDKLVIYFVVGE